MNPSELIRSYLAAREARDLARAQSMLAPGFSMQFPGPVMFTSLAQLIEWPDGAAFSGIRFIDRFTVADGKLADQTVWNDLAEVKAG